MYVAGIALLCCAALAGVRSAASGDANKVPGSIVYPASPNGLRMSHATPAHRALACEQCHDAAKSSTHAAQSLLPREGSCAPCHAERIDRAHTDSEHCGFCHRGFDPAQSLAIRPARRPPARLSFSHATHAQAKLACTSCHDTADPARSPTLPSMSQCLDCHRNERALACNRCHTSLPSGRLRTVFPEGKLVPRSAFLGMAHDADFSVRHRWLAAEESATCSSCHVESECSACHDGERRPRSLHPNDYLTLHAQDAQRNATRCGSCHSTQSFCLSCHARLGVSPISAPDLAAPKRLHPPSSVWLRGPMLHAREAERSLSTCVSCHAERDCIGCHGARGVGAGLSPHPPGFREQCGARLANNPRACLLCHGGNAEALRSRCR